MKIPKNFSQMMFTIVGIAMVFFGLWQLDLLMSPYIWGSGDYKKLWTINYELFPNMTKGLAYDLMFTFVGVGLILAILSLWLWND